MALIETDLYKFPDKFLPSREMNQRIVGHSSCEKALIMVINPLYKNLGNLALIVALGIFMTLLPFALFNWSLKRIEAGKTSVITFAEPMTATALGLILYGEDITLETAAGLAMILIALMLVGREKS